MAREMKDSGIEWIGEIPADWIVVRIKYIRNNEVDSFQDGDWIESPYIIDNGIRYLTTGNVGDGVFKQQGNGYISEETFSLLNCKYAYPNDLVISRLNEPYGRACILPYDEEKYVLAVDIVILRTNNDKRYLCYLMQCEGYQNKVQDSAKGTTMKRISRSNLGNIALPIAPKDKQKTIADYLDTECAKIDSVIDQTRASIEEYKKLKQAVITQAVTKGIRPGRQMKDSGIEWIGEIAEQFEVIKLKYLCDILDQYRSPITADQRNQEAEVLYDYYGASGAIDKIDGYTIDDHVMLIGEDGANLRMRNLPLMYEVDGKAWINNHAHILKPKQGTDFYYLLFVLEALDINVYITGSAQPKLSQDNLKRILVPIPSLSEQCEIAEYIKKKTTEINVLIEQKEKSLLELNSYKKSLIYEYVTGKKEVPA